MDSAKSIEYASNALKEVMKAFQGEKLTVVCDDIKEDIGWVFAQAGLKTGLNTRIISLRTDPKTFREELPAFLVESLISSKPDLTVNCLRGQSEETPFRIKLIELETRNKTTRLGHGPGVTTDMLTEGALALSVDEYRKMSEKADTLIAATEDANSLLLSTPRGTSLKMSIKGRGFFKDMIITNDKWGNLPTGELTIGPVENSLEGVLVCDLAVGGIGLISTPVEIKCSRGKAVSVVCADREVQRRVKKALSTDRMSSVVGEMAVGLNPKARLVEEFLETEKMLNTAHIAFGRNIDYPTGGKNASGNHMDFLVDNPDVSVVLEDGEKIDLLIKGKIVV